MTYFYAYAGYYEWFITTEPMPKPFVLMRRFHKIKNAIKYAMSFQDTVHYMENTRKYLPESLQEIISENNEFLTLEQIK